MNLKVIECVLRIGFESAVHGDTLLITECCDTAKLKTLWRKHYFKA